MNEVSGDMTCAIVVVIQKILTSASVGSPDENDEASVHGGH